MTPVEAQTISKKESYQFIDLIEITFTTGKGKGKLGSTASVTLFLPKVLADMVKEK